MNNHILSAKADAQKPCFDKTTCRAHLLYKMKKKEKKEKYKNGDLKSWKPARFREYFAISI